MKLKLTVFLTILTVACSAQTPIVIDGDTIHLRDSLDGKVVLLSYIKRGEQNKEAIWMTYDRRPGVDPWIVKPLDKETKYSEDNFVKYWLERDIRILGVITTYDDCRCFKHKMTSSPDMYLIHFKILPEDWNKMKELDSEMGYYCQKTTSR